MNKIETTLQIAMAEKGKTLRPEIRLMNQVGIGSFARCFLPPKFSYGFQILVGVFKFLNSTWDNIPSNNINNEEWWVMQLLNETSTQERAKAIQSNQLYLDPDGYFFELLERMTADVERQQNNPKRKMLLSQLRTITKEAKEAAKTFRRAK